MTGAARAAGGEHDGADDRQDDPRRPPAPHPRSNAEHVARRTDPLRHGAPLSTELTGRPSPHPPSRITGGLDRPRLWRLLGREIGHSAQLARTGRSRIGTELPLGAHWGQEGWAVVDPDAGRCYWPDRLAEGPSGPIRAGDTAGRESIPASSTQAVGVFRLRAQPAATSNYPTSTVMVVRLTLHVATHDLRSGMSDDMAAPRERQSCWESRSGGGSRGEHT